MQICVYCQACKNEYPITINNSQIQGPVFSTTCPICNVKTERNFSKFFENQLSQEYEFTNQGGIQQAIILQRACQYIERKVYRDGYKEK